MPEHGWAAARGPMVAFERLSRFGRWSIVLSFTGRALLLNLLWLTTALFLYVNEGPFALLIAPFAAIAWLCLPPLIAFRDLTTIQLGPFHLRVVDERHSPPCAYAWEKAPDELMRAVRRTLILRNALAQLTGVSLMGVTFALALPFANAMPLWVWMGAALVLLAGVSFGLCFWVLAGVLRTRTQTHCLRLVA